MSYYHNSLLQVLYDGTIFSNEETTPPNAQSSPPSQGKLGESFYIGI